MKSTAWLSARRKASSANIAACPAAAARRARALARCVASGRRSPTVKSFQLRPHQRVARPQVVVEGTTAAIFATVASHSDSFARSTASGFKSTPQMQFCATRRFQ